MTGVRLPPPRGYQDKAVAAITDHLTGGGRGTVVLACGTGKTLVGAHATVRLVPAGLVVVACPSLALVAQTLAVWSAAGVPDAVLAVCSDTTVSDAAVHVSDLHCPVTTHAHKVAAWIRRTNQARLRLVLVTHQSAAILGQSLIAANAMADLLVVDEAHRTAGRIDKQAAALHHDDGLPARRRLYMTATPKVSSTPRRSGNQVVLSMDDPATFGARVFTYPFADAINDGWLDDYRVAVIGVTRQEVLSMLRSAADDASLEVTGASLRTMVLQAALGKAAVEFNLRRILAFTKSILESRNFAATLAATLASLPAQHRPKGTLTAVHVDGTRSIAERQTALNLLTDPPRDGWTVLSNARCLSEGIDVPAVDAVVFASPKESEVDIVQAVGRALRRNPRGSGIATVLVPVLLPDDPDHVTGSDDEWATVCRVVQALRALDSSLGAELDERRARAAARGQHSPADPNRHGDEAQHIAELPQRVLIRLPDGYGIRDVLDHITVRVLHGTTDTWWDRLGELRAFQAEHGHLRVPYGTPLATWAQHQRSEYHRRILERARIEALDSLGFEWAPQQQLRERALAAARDFHTEHGHLRVPENYPGEVNLFTWLVDQRRRNRHGRLSADLRAELTRLGMRWESPDYVTWHDAYDLAAEFYATHQHLRPPHGYTVNGYDLFRWLVLQRGTQRAGKLAPDRIAALDAIGMVWDLDQARWDDNFTMAVTFAEREGHLKPREGHREGPLHLYAWLKAQRNRRRQGTLPAERITRLTDIGMNW